MIPYLLFTAGVAAISLFGAGCAKQQVLPPKEPRAPKKPQDSLAPKIAPQASKPEFPKTALTWEGRFSSGNGYELIRQSVAQRLNHSQGKAIPLQGYSLFQAPHSLVGQGEFLDFLIAHPQRTRVAKDFIDHLAGFDGQKEDLSRYDYLYSSYYLHTRQWHDPWGWENFLNEKSLAFSIEENIKVIGRPLLDPATKKSVATQSRDMLQSLATYLRSKAPDHPQRKLLALVEHFSKGE